MSEVIVHRRALCYLQRLSHPDRERVRTVLARLGENPTVYPGVVHMTGEWAGYQRIRVGELRVIYWHDEQDDIIYVDHIGPRGDVYKQ